MTDSPGRPADEPRKVPTPPETAADDAGTPDTTDAPEPRAADPAATAAGAAASPWTATDAPRLDALRAAAEDESATPTADAPRGADASKSAAEGAGHASAADAHAADAPAGAPAPAQGSAPGPAPETPSPSPASPDSPTSPESPAATTVSGADAPGAADEAGPADAAAGPGTPASATVVPASAAQPSDANPTTVPSAADNGTTSASADPARATKTADASGTASDVTSAGTDPSGTPGGSAAPASPASEGSPAAPDTGAPSAASDSSPAADGSGAAPSASPVPPGWSAQQPPAASGWGAPGGSGHGVPPGWGAPHQQPHAQQPRPPQAPGWGAPGGPPPAHGWGAPGGPGWGAPPRWQGSATPAAKPGIIPLRPLGVGEVLDGAIAAMRAHWKLMIGLSLVVALVTQAIAVPAQWAILRNVDLSVLDEQNPDADQLRDIMGPLLGSTAVLFVVMLLGQLVMTGILTLVVSRAVLGKDITLARAWQGTRPLLWRLLGVSALTPLIPAGLFLACLLPGLVLAALFGAAGGAVLVLGFIGGGVLFVYAYVLLALATPALILEKQTVAKALARSRKLVTGSWWRVCGILLLIMILSGILGAIVQTPFSLATGFSQFGAAAVPDSFTDAMIVGIGGVIAYAITFPFNAGATALLYIDQRMRREALDLELARAAGLVPDDATPAAS